MPLACARGVPASRRVQTRRCGVRHSKRSTGPFCPPSAVEAHPQFDADDGSVVDW